MGLGTISAPARAKKKRRHLRRNRFGQSIKAGAAYQSFKRAREEGMLDPQFTWRTFNRRWRHRRAVRRIARASRKRNRS